MILRGCTLLEVEEAERNSALQTAATLAPEEENILVKDPEPGRSTERRLANWGIGRCS